MKYLSALLTILFSINASANLLDQVRLEDVMRERATGVIRLLDPDAKVFVQIKFDGIDGDLPGGFSTKSSAVPANPDVDDIKAVTVTVLTKKDPVPEEVKKAVVAALSVPEKKVKVDYKQWEFLKDQQQLSSEITVQNLNEVISGGVTVFLNRFGMYLGFAMLAFAVLGFVQSWMRSRDVKGQTQELVTAVKAMGEAGGSSRAQAVAPVESTVPQQQAQSFAGPSSKIGPADDYLATLGLESLKELFGDCYWTNSDGYAHFLWRSLPVKTRESLINEMEYMKEYVNYFFSQRPVDLNVHEHPYYLNPQTLAKTSQEDVLSQVTKKVALWTALSPLRQQRLELGMMDRVKALQSAESAKTLSIEGKKSPLRELPITAEIGEINAVDELAVYENPDSIPTELRPKVKSLVWLALHDASYITQVLNPIDAKTLAMGWVGPKPVLEKLESCIPEKKRAMMNEYRLKSRPSRRSAAFAMLHNAGIQQPETAANNDESTKAA